MKLSPSLVRVPSPSAASTLRKGRRVLGRSSSPVIVLWSSGCSSRVSCVASLSNSSLRGDGRTFSPDMSGSPPVARSPCPMVDVSPSLSGARGATGMWACSKVELGLSLSVSRSCTERGGRPGPQRLAPYQKKPGGHGLTLSW